ncbi:NAD(+) diphosphatase [Papillibacter cinnamivorans]|uniref:NAD(+) diphosphatase n=1 Tax=Papillibacter cinnamivorans DSM 12816 TaxID=1122930 RepID=A0A1W2BHY1_9FIRM|nr:NAD(+) diphosphatase [Papillibacter cinnamivorans]SMC72543.1 NAD+ diphosphatase [Papillibacter cinnamivorans DSM 12816]
MTEYKSMYDRFTAQPNFGGSCAGCGIVFAVNSSSILVKTGEGAAVFPGMEDFGSNPAGFENTVYLGTVDGVGCGCTYYDESLPIPRGMAFENLRNLLSVLDESLGLVAARALHLANWLRQNRYCGVCGSPTLPSGTELAKKCPVCGNSAYPKISPAVIMAIVKEDRILLAHNRRFAGRMYSVLAGFVEPGESIEECAKREIMEEAGIRIRNIRYFGSQPWPFPDSLMIGLTAEYDGGELKADGTELDDAGWFRADELPTVPGTVSIAGRLIRWFTDGDEA